MSADLRKYEFIHKYPESIANVEVGICFEINWTWKHIPRGVMFAYRC